MFEDAYDPRKKRGTKVVAMRAHAAHESRVNGWDIWQDGGDDWRVARIDADGEYLAAETFSTRRAAVKFAQTTTPPDLADKPVAKVLPLSAHD